MSPTIQWSGCAQNGAVCPIDNGLCTGLGGSGSGRTTGSALPTSSSTTSSLPCLAEGQACQADPACSSCLETMVIRAEACQGVGYDSETSTCDEGVENICCAFEEASDCLSDDLLVAFLGGSYRIFRAMLS